MDWLKCGARAVDTHVRAGAPGPRHRRTSPSAALPGKNLGGRLGGWAADGAGAGRTRQLAAPLAEAA
jgi:hypothetical protein